MSYNFKCKNEDMVIWTAVKTTFLVSVNLTFELGILMLIKLTCSFIKLSLSLYN
jgi:hypothetical protein